ncbi:DNA-directed RNA polymerase subunit alpha [Patescibacteria group bacterium]|nr:MAG: DNA-directed RNA polymerase subunit alpha [Patescibacteria group bacterium]
MENILLPSAIRFEAGERPNEGVVVVEPCYHGYGTTLGNALRRVMLSSLTGAAVTAIRIKGATHEFQAIDGVKEDVLEMILNLKGLRLKSHSEEPVKLSLKVKGAKVVTAKDIEKNADVEIANPSLTIATLTDDKAVLDMEITVGRGRGYSPTEERPSGAAELGTIAVDALFSPVRSVGYKVENTRVGEITNYDKLTMTIETDGTITPEEAVKSAANTLIDHFSILLQNPPAEGGEMPVEEPAKE